MRMKIIINDKLMAAALKISSHTTHKEAVEEALKLLVKIKKQEHLKSLRGKLLWEAEDIGALEAS